MPIYVEKICDMGTLLKCAKNAVSCERMRQSHIRVWLIVVVHDIQIVRMTNLLVRIGTDSVIHGSRTAWSICQWLIPCVYIRLVSAWRWGARVRHVRRICRSLSVQFYRLSAIGFLPANYKHIRRSARTT